MDYNLHFSLTLFCLSSIFIYLFLYNKLNTIREGIMENIYQTLCNRIVESKYPPNTWLREEDLAKEFNVSRTTVRKNLHQIETGLRLYAEEDITGIEFPVGSRCIDILALDKDNNYVVIELKVSRGYDRVVGQLLRYMAWIRKNHADAGQHVRGIIIAREISEDLLLACSEVPDITLYEYQLSVSLKKINQK